MNTAIVRRNLRLLIGILCLTPTYVLVPIFVVFFQTRGLNQTGVFLTQAVFAAIVVAVELPSGWFADRFGYKHSLIIGTVVVTLSYAAYIPDLGLTSILIAEALCGLGFGFMSGADSSLAYGSLAAIGETDALSERYGTNRQVWSNVTGVILGTAGGLLTLVDIYLAVIVQVLVTFITIPLALLLHEPPHMKPESDRPNNLKNALQDMKSVLVYTLHGHPIIKWLVIFSAFLDTAMQIVFWLTQPYFQAAHVPLWLFGVLNTILSLAAIVFALLTKRFKKLGRKRVLAWFVVIIAGSYVVLALGPAWWLLPSLLGFYLVRSTFYSLIDSYMHDEITDDTIRASVISVRRLVSQLLFIPTGLAIGIITDTYSLTMALWWAGIIWAITGTVILVRMVRLRLFAPVDTVQPSNR